MWWFLMKDEPDIVKELREVEKLGRLQSQVTSDIGELETVEESSEDVPEQSVGFADDDVDRNTGEDDTDYKKAEEPTFKADVMWRLLAENIPAFVLIVDHDNKILFVNRTVSGLTREKVIGSNVCDYVLPKYHDVLKKTVKQVFETKKPASFDSEGTGSEGSTLWYENYVAPIIEEGKADNVIFITRDITEQKKAEEEERIGLILQDIIEKKKAEEKIRNILESSPDAITVTDLQGNITECNEATLQLHKFSSKEEIIGKSALMFFPKREQKRATENLQKTLKEGSIKNIEYTLLRKDGKEFPAELSASFIKDPSGKPVAFVAITKDITERKKAEGTLKESEEKFRTFVDTASDFMFIADKNGIFTDANEAMIGTLVFSRDELIGMSIPQILTKESLENDFKPNWEKFVKNGKISIDATFATKDGKEIYGELKAVAIYDSDGKFAGSRIVFYDLTERKEAEERIKKQNIKLKKLDRIKTEFLNVTSHELRTPMAAMKGYIQMMLKQKLGDVTPEQKDALNVTLRNINRLDHLVNDILDISRLESGTMKFVPEKTDISKMIKESLQTMQYNAEMKNIKINTELEKDIPTLFIDQERIKQVIVNLIDNAIKFSPPNSTVRIQSKKDKNDVLVEVQDFGRGIPNNKQKKIFERFYQVDSGMDRKFGGVGLGLAISQGIVKSHGGNIWVDNSTKDKGSTIKFNLPIDSVGNIEEKFKQRIDKALYHYTIKGSQYEECTRNSKNSTRRGTTRKTIP